MQTDRAGREWDMRIVCAFSWRPDRVGPSQGIGFSDLRAAQAAFNHLMKESEQIRKINPESAIQTARVESAVHQRIVPLHHHEPLAFEAMHRPNRSPFKLIPQTFGTSQQDTDVVALFSGDD